MGGRNEKIYASASCETTGLCSDNTDVSSPAVLWPLLVS